jgi:hypothetical protein
MEGGGQESNLRPPAYQAITLVLRPLQARGEQGVFGVLSTELPPQRNEKLV